MKPVRAASPAAARVGRVSRYQALRLARRLRHALHHLPSASQPGGRGLSLRELLALHGSASAGILLVLWGLFSQLPVGGVGNVAAVALWWLAWSWFKGESQTPIPQRLLNATLSPRWSARVLRWLGAGYRRAGLWLRPRWFALQGLHGRLGRALWAAWVSLQALVIFLPIPMGNLLPGLSLMALGLGRLIEDGSMHLVSLVLGLLGLLYTWWLGDLAWGWLLAALHGLGWAA